MLQDLGNRMEAWIKKIQEIINKDLEELKNEQSVMNNMINWNKKKNARWNQQLNNWGKKKKKKSKLCWKISESARVSQAA